MAYCVKCGNQIGNDGLFCTSCGESVPSSTKPLDEQLEQQAPLKEQLEDHDPLKKQQETSGQQNQQAPQGQKTANAQDQIGEKLNKLNDTADTTGAYDKADIEQNKVMAILSYIGILVLVPIFAAPQSKFARYHANQGLVLAICEILFSIVYSILSTIILAISWRLAFIMTIIGLLWFVFLVLAVLGIVNASNGKAKELPVIGKYKILK
ncbi:MAG: DUF4870 domain-containing protein [Saccharofermentanales bacterium]